LQIQLRKGLQSEDFLALAKEFKSYQIFTVVYCDPVKTALKLKVERAPALDEAARVTVAEVIAPADRGVVAGAQVIVMYVPAFDGLQLFTAIVKFSAMLPVFLT
jgi:hypothetical protein